MITTKIIPRKKTQTVYVVPVTQHEVKVAKLKITATSPEEAVELARAQVKSFTPVTIMSALGTCSSSIVEYGKPWTIETIKPDTTPPVTVIGAERRKS